jgi:hypothetical protein
MQRKTDRLISSFARCAGVVAVHAEVVDLAGTIEASCGKALGGSRFDAG